MPRKPSAAARGHITPQSRTILQMIRDNPHGVTAADLAAIVPKYTGRISELRQAGYQVHLVKDAAGAKVYRETGVNQGPRVPPRRGEPSFLFLVGPPLQSFVSVRYATDAERDAAVLAYYNAYECDPAQFFWLDDPGDGGGLRCGPVLFHPPGGPANGTPG